MKTTTLTTIAAAAAVTLALAGCGGTADVADEQAYVDALHAGTVPPGLIDTDALRDVTIDVGYSTCEIPREDAIANAERNLTDPMFADALPVLLVDAAAEHLCGAR